MENEPQRSQRRAGVPPVEATGATQRSPKKRRGREQGAGGAREESPRRGAEWNMGMFAERLEEKPRHKGRSYWGKVQAPPQFSPLLPAPCSPASFDGGMRV